MTERGYLPIEGGELNYAVDGEGEPVVFVHAGIANLEMWDEQIEAFTNAGFRVIRYDTRGFGWTKTESVPFNNRRDLAAVLDFFQVERAHLIGCSRGGQIALDFALEFPDRVRSLVPVCAGIGGAPFVDAPDEMPTFEEMEKTYEAGDWDKLAGMEVDVFVIGFHRTADQVQAGLRERVYAMSRMNMGRADGEPQPIPLDPPAYGRLDDIKVPTLVIIGALDGRATVEMADVLTARIAGARKLVIENAAHVPSMEYPELFNREVIAFLKSVQ